MLISEFIDRTGYQPSATEYIDIESEYNLSPLDKDAFCKMWCSKNPDKAGSLQRAAKKQKYISDNVERTISRVLRHCRRRTNHGEKLSREEFQTLIKDIDMEIARDTIRSMKDWRGVTQNWQDNVWTNYWVLFECVAYGY